MSEGGDGGEQANDSWDWFVTDTGADVVRKELGRALGKDKPTLARLEKIMNLRVTHQDGATHSTHLRGDIHEIRVNGPRVIYRLLYARDGKRRVLLALRVFEKKTQKTPRQEIEVAENRWADWKRRHPLG